MPRWARRSVRTRGVLRFRSADHGINSDNIRQKVETVAPPARPALWRRLSFQRCGRFTQHRIPPCCVTPLGKPVTG